MAAESGEHCDGQEQHREVHRGHGSGRPVRRQGSDGVAEVDPSLPVIYLHIGKVIARACEDRAHVGRGEGASQKGSRSRLENGRGPAA